MPIHAVWFGDIAVVVAFFKVEELCQFPTETRGLTAFPSPFGGRQVIFTHMAAPRKWGML